MLFFRIRGLSRENLGIGDMRLDGSSIVLRQFDYRPSRWQTVTLFVLASSGAVMLAYFALTLDRPVNARGFQLTPKQGKWLFGVFAALSPIGLFCLGAMVYVAYAYDRRIALTSTHLILPKPTRLGMSRDEIHIPLESVSNLSVHDFIGATQVLRIDYSEGVVNVPSNMFGNVTVFHEMCRAVEGMVDGYRTDSN